MSIRHVFSTRLHHAAPALTGKLPPNPKDRPRPAAGPALLLDELRDAPMVSLRLVLPR
jgi:hypothetical protein